MGEHFPRATCFEDVKDAVDYLPHVDSPGMTSKFSWRNQRFYELPFAIAQVAFIGFSPHSIEALRRFPIQSSDSSPFFHPLFIFAL